MSKVYKRILKKKKERDLTWDELAKLAGIPVSTWMTGVPYAQPSDDDLKAVAPVLGTTFEYLKYGK